MLDKEVRMKGRDGSGSKDTRESEITPLMLNRSLSCALLILESIFGRKRQCWASDTIYPDVPGYPPVF